MGQNSKEPIVEWTLDRNIYVTYWNYGGMSWATFEVDGDTVDLTRMQVLKWSIRPRLGRSRGFFGVS